MKSVLIAIGLIIPVAAGLWINSTVQEINAVLQGYEQDKHQKKNEIWVVEQGAKLEADQVFFFAGFAGVGEIIKKTLEPTFYKGAFLPREDYEFELELRNDCAKERCYQSRVRFHEIPPALWRGLLGVEDVRFLKHKGLDYYAILRALVIDIKALSFVQGGSTLTQQLAKNLFLSPEKTLRRKFKEAVYSLYLESILTKEEILNLYLNEVYWGQVSGVQIRGVKAASQIYFRKKLGDISPYEAAILVAMLKGPGVFNPGKGIQRLKLRTKTIYEKLQALKLAPDSRDLVWTDEEWVKWQKDFHQDVQKHHYTAIFSSMRDESRLGAFEQFVLQVEINNILAQAKLKTKHDDLAVKVHISSYRCQTQECQKKYSYYTKEERDLKIAIEQETHQVGSVVKPLIYRELRRLGVEWEAEYSTEPIRLNLKSGVWEPGEASSAAALIISAREALQKSRNRPLIRMAEQVGFNNLEDELTKKFRLLLTPLAQYPSQLLGAIELSVLEVAQLYEEFEELECSEMRAGDDGVLLQLLDPKKTTISKVAKPFIREMSLFGKTGTTNNGRDNWFVAIDGMNIYVIWVGAESLGREDKLALYGSTSAYKIFEGYLEKRGKRPVDYSCL